MTTTKKIPQVVVCGAVDDGKSTLLGRLLAGTESIPTDQIEKVTDNQGLTDYSLLTDGLAAEKEQNITIDVAYRYLFSHTGQRFLLADCPGHEQYTRNMAVAAAASDISLLVIDMTKGVRTQTLRHFRICKTMGIRSFVVALNKADFFPDEQSIRARTLEIREALATAAPEMFVSTFDVNPIRVVFVVLSALTGQNVIEKSKSYVSSESLMDELLLASTFLDSPEKINELRIPVQLVIREKTKRFYAGQVHGKNLSTSDTLTVIPTRTRASVRNLFVNGEKVDSVGDGAPVLIEFDEHLDISRGDVLVHETEIPTLSPTRNHLIDLVWISPTELKLEDSYLLYSGPSSTTASITSIESVQDVDSGLSRVDKVVKNNDIARVNLTTNSPLLIDSYESSRMTGNVVLCNRLTGETVASGMYVRALSEQSHLYSFDFLLSREIREQRAGIRSGVIWLTGLSGSGKSTLANALESMLWDRHIRSYVLDGDDIRQKISEDLGFSPEDRAENVRRVARVAEILVETGIIPIVALVSPFKSDRDLARRIFDKNDFIEVFVDTPLHICQSRDPKGLYARARSQKNNEMTGIGQVYEPPKEPFFHLDGNASVEENAHILLQWVLNRRF